MVSSDDPPELVGLRRPAPHPLSAKGVEREVGFALGHAYPWLLKLKRPVDAGMLWAIWPGEHAEAVNDPVAR